MFTSSQFRKGENVVRVHLHSLDRVSGTPIGQPSFNVPDALLNAFDETRPVYVVLENFINDASVTTYNTGTAYNVQALSNVTLGIPPYLNNPGNNDASTILNFSNTSNFVPTNVATHQKYVETNQQGSSTFIISWDNMPTLNHVFGSSGLYNSVLCTFARGAMARTTFMNNITVDTLGIPLDARSLRNSKVWNFRFNQLWTTSTLNGFDLGNFMISLVFYQKPSDVANNCA